MLAVDGYNHLLEDLEELEAIRAYDEANTSGEDRVSFEQVVEEIEQEHEE